MVSSACVGKASCEVDASNAGFGDPCVGTVKRLSVQATCSGAAQTGTCASGAENDAITLSCPAGQVVTSISFASYGTPSGTCGAFVAGSCQSSSSAAVVSNACVGKGSCTLSASNSLFGDPCVGTVKRLSVQATCGSAPQTSGTQGDAGKGVAPPAVAPPAVAVARPGWNTGKGFFVASGKIYDANGVEFRIRGVNHTHWWGGTNEGAIPYISNANANAARAVFGPGAGATTPALRESIVRQYIAQRIVPVVDYHNATCDEDPASLSAAVDLWVGDDKAWLQSLERYVVLNVTNEWGPNSTVWRDAYVDAVARLRQAGVKNLLMIDAGGACGQLAESVEAWGNAVFDSDPEKNIVFSIHQYGFWVDPGSPEAGTWDGRQPYDIDAELTRLQATGLPIVIGEFSSSAFSQVTYTTPAAVAAYEAHGVGWLAWMWNNPGGDPTVDMALTNVYQTSADLTDFGRLLIEDGTLGMKAIAKRATIF
jgi:mannan endo-1,4-beta-mannosidase